MSYDGSWVCMILKNYIFIFERKQWASVKCFPSIVMISLQIKYTYKYGCTQLLD